MSNEVGDARPLFGVKYLALSQWPRHPYDIIRGGNFSPLPDNERRQLYYFWQLFLAGNEATGQSVFARYCKWINAIMSRLWIVEWDFNLHTRQVLFSLSVFLAFFPFFPFLFGVVCVICVHISWIIIIKKKWKRETHCSVVFFFCDVFINFLPSITITVDRLLSNQPIPIIIFSWFYTRVMSVCLPFFLSPVVVLPFSPHPSTPLTVRKMVRACSMPSSVS